MLPAIKNILEQLAQQFNPLQVQAFIEVPLAAYCIDMGSFTFAEEVRWLPRESRGRHTVNNCWKSCWHIYIYLRFVQRQRSLNCTK
ncbi:MAG: hypothetical protein ACSLEM_06795 [Candidatus Malihini olakiniferum]